MDPGELLTICERIRPHAEPHLPESLHTLVIGGGIAGLAAAHRLVCALGPDKVRLLEASDYLGGHVRTTREAGYQLDWGPNGFLDREPAMLDWIRELGLEGELVPANQAAARRFLLLDGRLVELVGPPRFLLSPALSVAGRARVMMEPLIPAKRDDAPESVYDFAKRRIGREAADTLVSAMVLGIFGGDAKQLSLAHCFPRMAVMEREHGSLFRAMLAKKSEAGGSRSRATAGSPIGPGGTLTSLRGGIGRLAERAAETLGDVAQTGGEVTELSRDSDGFVATYGRAGARPSQLRASNLVLAVPAFVASRLLGRLAPNAATQFDRARYASIAVVCTGHARADIRHDLHGFGYLIPPRENRETLGCLWTSTIFDGTAPEDCVLLRTMVGGAHHPDSVDRSDADLLAIVKRDVFDVLGVSGNAKFIRILRHRRAIPQYGLDHADLLAAAIAAERAHPCLYFTGSALRGVAMIDCVADARRVADRVLEGGA